MKAVILYASFGTLLLLFAQGDTGGNNGIVNFDWGNLTALGIVAIVVVWLVTKTIPGMVANHSDTLKVISVEYTATIKTAFDKIDALHIQTRQENDKLNETLREIIANCAIAQKTMCEKNHGA